MAKIGILVDPDPGHFFPALGLSFKIHDLGHQVHIYGIKDIEIYFLNYAFPFHVIFEDVYPKGYIIEYQEMHREKGASYDAEGKFFPKPHIISILNDKYAEVFENENLHCLMTSYFYSTEALFLKNSYPALPILIFTTYLRTTKQSPKIFATSEMSQLEDSLKLKIINKYNIHDSEVFFNTMDNIDEIILCPREFDYLNKKLGANVHYLGPVVRPSTNSTDFIENLKIPKNKKILYVSLGTQTRVFREKSLKIFKFMFQLMALKSSSNWFMIIAVGGEFPNQNFLSVKNSVEVINWAPQLEILNFCHVVITHGGLGTIKESIINAVPMLVFPMGYDQLYNGQLVEDKGLGYSLCIDKVKLKDVRNTIQKILGSEDLKKRLGDFQKIFIRDDSTILKQIIENNLNY